jgi:hypothetical protein
MDSDSLNFYVEVIKEVIEAGTVPTMDNMEKHIGHRARRHDLDEAIEELMAEGRIRKQRTLVGWDADWQPLEAEYYYPAPRKLP